MSSANDQNKPVSRMHKINTYIYIFAGFIAVTLLAFITYRYAPAEFTSQARTQPQKAEEVVITKDPDLAKKKQILLKDMSGDYYMGNQYAPVIVIEYASLSCPHCAHFHEDVVEPLVPSYINSGKVKYVYRDFPLNAPALAAAKLTHCANPERFFSFIKVLFKSQDQWAFTPNYEEILKNIAKLGGVNEEKFHECQKDQALETAILKTQQDANEVLEVDQTPTIFINGSKYEGKHEYKEVAAFIDTMLKDGN